jgi:hypothetical protein
VVQPSAWACWKGILLENLKKKIQKKQKKQQQQLFFTWGH